MVNRKQFAIFDFDGVIFDSKDIAIRNVELLRRQPEFEHLPSPARIGNFSEIFCGTLRTSLLRFGLTPEESQRFFDSHANLMSEQRELMGLFTGVSEFLRCIPSDSWAIVTSAYEEVVYDILEGEGVHTADLIVIGHSIKKSKSAKTSLILRICCLRGALKFQTCYILAICRVTLNTAKRLALISLGLITATIRGIC